MRFVSIKFSFFIELLLMDFFNIKQNWQFFLPQFYLLFLSKLDKHGDVDILVGVVKISKKILSKDIPYKYVIISEDKSKRYYEEIMTPETPDGGYTNRLLQRKNFQHSMYIAILMQFCFPLSII